jgi:hypothetical protein
MQFTHMLQLKKERQRLNNFLRVPEIAKSGAEIQTWGVWLLAHVRNQYTCYLYPRGEWALLHTNPFGYKPMPGFPKGGICYFCWGRRKSAEEALKLSACGGTIWQLVLFFFSFFPFKSKDKLNLNLWQINSSVWQVELKGSSCDEELSVFLGRFLGISLAYLQQVTGTLLSASPHVTLGLLPCGLRVGLFWRGGFLRAVPMCRESWSGHWEGD